MNQLYKFYLDETERIFNEAKSACDNRISKVRKGYPIHSDILRELNARELDLEGQLYKKSIDRFFREMEKDYHLDSQLTQESAFLNCCIKFNISKDERAISMLADFKANEKLRTYCYDLMNLTKSNKNLLEKADLDDLRVKKNYQNPIWKKKKSNRIYAVTGSINNFK